MKYREMKNEMHEDKDRAYTKTFPFILKETVSAMQKESTRL